MAFTSRDADFTILAADERLQTLRLDRLLDAWHKAGGDTQLPGADFMIPERHDYLPGMLIMVDVECIGDDRRFRYRSVGSHFTDHLRVDPAGTYMDQHPESDFAVKALRACSLVVETRRPIHARLQRDIDGRSFGIEILLLPIAGADGGVAHLLIAQIFTPLAP